ncbi:nitroreductase family protein [Spirochaeta thermophila]|uniref:nitroreductase family protein n=1 Tax=Winmispira thermophila TaxID=154 RepID=UPI000310B567|nr:nitroreductase family protein [Spirochaeta thermophila]
MGAISLLKRIYRKLRITILRKSILLASKSKLVLVLFLILDKQLIWEYVRYLRGLHRYNRLERLSRNEYSLRRHLHGIEKGLTQKAFRSEFALSYILETVMTLKNLAPYLHKKNPSFFKYSLQVLEEYFFRTHSDDERYIRAMEIFNELKAGHSVEEIPEEEKCANGDSSFFSFLCSRSSVRVFSKEVPTDEVLKYAIRCALQAPSGCNRQPYRFVIIKNDKELLRKVAALPPGGGKKAFDAPVVVFVIGDYSAFPTTRSFHEVYVDSALASLAFVLALHEQGVDSCFMNWPRDYKLSRRVETLLALKPYETVVTSIAVGYREMDSRIALSIRKTIDEILEIK